MSLLPILWILFLAVSAFAGEDNTPVSTAGRGLLRGEMNYWRRGCPQGQPSTGSSCQKKGQFCQYDFVYIPTIEIDQDTGNLICQLPYTSCEPLVGCSCEELEYLERNPLGWACFSAGLPGCDNDMFLSEPKPELAYQICKPNENRFP